MKTEVLKVYGWSGPRARLPGERNGSTIARQIIAASSAVAAERAIVEQCGYRPDSDFGSDYTTGHLREMVIALARPGIVFWKLPLDFSRGEKWCAARQEWPSAKTPAEWAQLYARDLAAPCGHHDVLPLPSEHQTVQLLLRGVPVPVQDFLAEMLRVDIDTVHWADPAMSRVAARLKEKGGA